jgi:hypothetical protein
MNIILIKYRGYWQPNKQISITPIPTLGMVAFTYIHAYLDIANIPIFSQNKS